ncbi:hypothetical protein F2Q68_00010747 [Brassica cretica]|uniref:Uncharacterized protein n=1 Tax=Brassica cretica TaxID=69181 RepID=A0A8S9KZK2_BRACR|nr:hypothetical protein F2Q68_00010747 [Brassica cretica]
MAFYMEAPLTLEEGVSDYGKSLKDMETSINVWNNRLAAPSGINRQTALHDCSAGKGSNSCSFLHAYGSELGKSDLPEARPAAPVSRSGELEDDEANVGEEKSAASDEDNEVDEGEEKSAASDEDVEGEEKSDVSDEDVEGEE